LDESRSGERPAGRRQLRELLALREPVDPLVNAVPDGVPVIAKTGNLERVSNAVGLVVTSTGPLTITVLDEDVDPVEARGLITELARTAFESYTRR
jgi:hypothetical protein